MTRATRRPSPGFAQRAVLVVGAVALGLVGAEIFLRVSIPREIFFDTWFTPGIHVPDEATGFAFAPGYRGRMWQRDGVWGVPLELDAHGFRPPVVGTGDAAPARVTIVGGASMMMGYGLLPEETIPARIAAHAEHRLHLRNTAWAGFDLYRNWLSYLEALGDEPLDLGVVALYRVTLASFADIPETIGEPPTVAPSEELFRFLDGVVLDPPGRIADRLGPWYYRSFLAHGILRRIDDAFWGRPVTAFDPPDDPATVGRGREGLIRLLDAMERHFAARGGRTLVVLLPMWAPPGYYGTLTNAIPAHLPRRDVHRMLRRELRVRDTIAEGHYSPSQADRVGRRIAREIDVLLGSGRTSPPD